MSSNDDYTCEVIMIKRETESKISVHTDSAIRIDHIPFKKPSAEKERPFNVLRS